MATEQSRGRSSRVKSSWGRGAQGNGMTCLDYVQKFREWKEEDEDEKKGGRSTTKGAVDGNRVDLADEFERDVKGRWLDWRHQTWKAVESVCRGKKRERGSRRSQSTRDPMKTKYKEEEEEEGGGGQEKCMNEVGRQERGRKKTQGSTETLAIHRLERTLPCLALLPCLFSLVAAPLCCPGPHSRYQADAMTNQWLASDAIRLFYVVTHCSTIRHLFKP